MYKRLALAGTAVLLLSGVALAWHVSDATATCSNGKLNVLVKLSDNGPGTYSDDRGDTGTFGDVDTFSYEAPSGGDVLVLNVTWNTEEHDTFRIKTDTCTQPAPPTPAPTPPATVTTLPAVGGTGK